MDPNLDALNLENVLTTPRQGLKDQLFHHPEDFMGINLLTIFAMLSSGAMIFGGVVPYIPQYYEIFKTRNASGFSLNVCLALLLANILRIFFWFGRRFELPLLAQSFIMIFAMLMLLQLCTQVLRESNLSGKRRRFADFQITSFWKWSYFVDYFYAVFLFICVGSYITFVLLQYAAYTEIIGFLAVFTEAMLGVPQFYKNYQNHSTSGMSVTMVVMWTSGDAFKTCYFIVREAPLQFSICGMMQICVDIAILLQVYLYRRSSGRTSRD